MSRLSMSHIVDSLHISVFLIIPISNASWSKPLISGGRNSSGHIIASAGHESGGPRGTVGRYDSSAVEPRHIRECQ